MKSVVSGRMAGIEKTLIRRMNDLADAACINLGLGELAFPTPKAILKYVRENCHRWRLGYTPNEGLKELRELIASKSGYGVEADRVCVTIGAQEAIFAALMVLVDTGDEVLVPDPGFPAYTSIVKMAGGTPRLYPLSAACGFSLDPEDIEKRLSARVKALIINSPHNPTGAVFGEEDVRKLASACSERGIVIISDEVYGEIFYERKPASPASYPGRWIAVNSLSKSHSMIGWRIGWGIAPPEVLKAMAAFHQLSVACASALSQHAAIFALKGRADGEKKSNVRELRRRRDLIMNCLRRYTDLRFVKPAGAFYIMVDVSSAAAKFGNSLEIAQKILTQEKVVTIPGAAFGPQGEGYLRLSFAADPEDIEEGVRRIGRFFG
jgi:aspartate/methionine/tyrosine aminotransferase